jgi:hypothetical protein
MRSFLDWLFDLVPVHGRRATALALAAFVTMVVAGTGTIRTGAWWWRVMLLAASAIWPLPDHPFQGPVVSKLSYQHGIHLADLLSIVGFAIAIVPWRRLRRPDGVTSGSRHHRDQRR